MAERHGANPRRAEDIVSDLYLRERPMVGLRTGICETMIDVQNRYPGSWGWTWGVRSWKRRADGGC